MSALHLHETWLALGLLSALLTAELFQPGHIFARFGRWAREGKEDGWAGFLIWKYTTCHLCLAGILALLMAIILLQDTGNVALLITGPVFSMCWAQAARRYLF